MPEVGTMVAIGAFLLQFGVVAGGGGIALSRLGRVEKDIGDVKKGMEKLNGTARKHSNAIVTVEAKCDRFDPGELTGK